jgi:type IV pilus assembly protein PilQ
MAAMKNMIRGWGRSAERAGLGLALIALLFATPAMAQRTLQDIQFTAGGGGKVDVTLSLSEPAPDASIFTTDDPPRIAIDLPDTRNSFGGRLVVGSGATSAISAVEAGGRTRVVIDLFRAASYESRAEGKNLIVTIAGSATTAGGAVVAANRQDPAKRVADGAAVSGVDFRRAADGTGRVILSFSAPGVSTDLRTEGSRIIVDAEGVDVPESALQKLDVVDFATPVQFIETRKTAGGARMIITATGQFESLAYQTEGEFVVEVSPVQAETASAAGSSILGLKDEEKTYSGAPVTLNFQDVPVRSVLQLLADVSQTNIVAADTVQGNITLRLVNVPWDHALDIVLQAKQLDQRQQGNVIWVAPQAEIAAFEQAKAEARLQLEQRTQLITEYIPINYGNAEQIAKLLTDESKQAQGGGGGSDQKSGGFLSNRGSVSFDQRTNTLLLNDVPSKIAEIRELIRILDRPVEQVLIESRIVIATEEFSREIGARFGISGGRDDAYYSGNLEANTLNRNSDVASRTENANRLRNWLTEVQNTEPGSPTPLPPILTAPTITRGLGVNLPVTDPSAGALALSILNAGYLLDLELSALEVDGRGEVVANPRVITANQQEAVIKQGQEVGYVTLQAGGGGTGNFTVEFKEVVLELLVTPTITQDNRVFLRMNVKKDEVEGFVTTPLFSVPQISKREVNTSVLVENGQTVVLGGVYEFKSIDDIKKVPFLGDVPVMGALFRNKLKSRTKAELLIFVTPKILSVDARN